MFYPGEYTYYFSLVDYPTITSDTQDLTFSFFIDPCSVTHFINVEPLIIIDKMIVDLP
jgi:hypothetical protein